MGDQRPVVIVGAGIVGVATAVWLQRLGRRVVLVDRGAPGEGASFGNGGVLAACAVVPVTVPGLVAQAPRMLAGGPLYVRWRYLPRLAPWLARYLAGCSAATVERVAAALLPLLGESLADHQALAAGTGAERFVVPSDYAYLYRDRAAFERDAFGWGVRARLGFRWTEEEGAAFRAREPGFAADRRLAVRLGGHGRVSDPGAYVKALARHVAAQGGEIRRGEASDVVLEAGRVAGVIVGGERVDAAAAVIAAGAWSGRLAAGLGLRVPLESERGYHLELWEPSWMPSLPVMLPDGKFVVTPMDGRIRVAGLVEYGGLAAGASAAPVRFLRRQVAAVMPGLRWRREAAWMGHRPAPADSIPVIGAVPGVEGAWLGFGHHHVGLTGGAATGRLLAQAVAGRRPNIDLAPYSPARFQ